MIELNGVAQTYLRAAGSLGWSFPASLGAKCAAGARKVLCFTGDGGFYYHLAELESARRCGIAVTVVVNNNSGFGQNLTGVRRVAGNRPGRGEELIRFGPTDFTAVARSFGVRGIRVERPGEIAPALAEAMEVGPILPVLQPELAALQVDPLVIDNARESFARFIRNGETAVFVRALDDEQVEFATDVLKLYLPIAIEVVPLSEPPGAPPPRSSRC